MDTIDYYNKNAEKYFKDTIDIDMKKIYFEFLEHVKDHGHILDVGCGSGRDSLYFMNQGYKVTATDASEGLVKLSSKYLDQEVLQMKFSEIDFEMKFDGVWASASLLHINRGNIKDVLDKLISSIKIDGVIYMSFKYGDNQFEQDGRFFNNYNEDLFKELLNPYSNIEIIKLWKSLDEKNKDKDKYWFNILIKKPT